jgi:hypothetical protein
MTGYLTRLAARSLPGGAAVRPRVATVFEPAGLADAAGSEEAEEHDADQARESRPAGPGRARSGAAVEAGSAPIPRQGPPLGSPAAAGAAVSPPTASQEARGSATAPPAARTTKGRASPVAARASATGGRTGEADDQPPEAANRRVEPAPAKTPGPLREGAPSAADGRVAPAPGPPAESVGGPLPWSRPSLEADALDVPGSPPGSAASPAPDRPAADPGLPSLVAAPTRRARRAASTASGDPSPPQPTVHVTIGRVEVRAVAAPAPARPAERERRPALTLAEYLQRREAGR